MNKKSLVVLFGAVAGTLLGFHAMICNYAVASYHDNQEEAEAD